MAGSVPKPNITMNKLPLRASPVAMAPANARYTIPQGKRPFNNPRPNNEAGVPLKSNLLNPLLECKHHIIGIVRKQVLPADDLWNQ